MEDYRKEYIKIVARVTNKKEALLEMVITEEVLKDYDIKVLIEKINNSDFLLGKLIKRQPLIGNFIFKKCLIIMMADGYDDYQKIKTPKSKFTITSGQEAFQSIITKKLWRKKFKFKDDVVAQVVHASGGINKLVMLPSFNLDKWLKFDFPNLYKLCSATPLKSYMKIYNEGVSGDIIEV